MLRLPTEIIEGFVLAMLRPIARFCLQKSFTFPEFAKLAKRAYFESAEQFIKQQGEKPSISQISALSGLDRRDLSRFQKEGTFFVRKENLLSRVIGQWQDNRQFSKAGKPNILSSEGVESEFFALVQSVSKDLNPYTVMSELERIKAISKDGGYVRLNTQVYVPRGNMEDGLRILGIDTQDLLAAVCENLTAQAKLPNLHLRTQYDNLSPQALPKIKEWFLKKGEKLHSEARRFISKFDKDVNPKIKDGGARAVLSSFALVEKAEDENK